MLHARITPFLMCRSLDKTLPFYAALGFECTFRGTEPGYAFVCGKGCAIRLLETDVDLTDERREQMIYLDVPDVDALWEELRGFLETLPPERVRAPFDQPYGQREMHVIEGPNLLLFGHAIG